MHFIKLLSNRCDDCDESSCTLNCSSPLFFSTSSSGLLYPQNSRLICIFSELIGFDKTVCVIVFVLSGFQLIALVTVLIIYQMYWISRTTGVVLESDPPSLMYYAVSLLCGVF